MDKFTLVFENVIAPICATVVVASCGLSFSYLLSCVGYSFFEFGKLIKNIEVTDND